MLGASLAGRGVWERMDTGVRKAESLGQEDSSGGGNGNPLQYSCCRIPWTDETGGLQSWGCKDSDMTEVISHSMLLFSILKLHHLDLALPINQ